MPGRSGRMSDRSFNGDYTSRYQRTKNDTLQTYAPTDRRVAREVRSGDTLASWVWNFDDVEGRLKSLMARGKYAEAKEYFDEVNGTIDANIDNLLKMMRAGGTGEMGKELAARAARIANGTFADEEVDFGGTKMSIGSVLKDGGQMMIDSARDEFESVGLSGTAADMMFNGSDQQRAAIRSLVNPILEAKRSGTLTPDIMQRVDLAEEVVNRWDELEGVFGSGVPYVVSRLQAMHDGSGGAADTLHSLTKAASTLASDGVDGKELARKVIGAYGSLKSRIFASDSDQKDSGGRPSTPDSVSPAKTMAFDAALSAAISACDARGVSADLSSAAFSSALSDVMDAQAYASAHGIDLVSTGHDVGKPVANAFGEYVADMVSGVQPTSGNPVNAFRSIRNMMDRMIVGGNDYRPQEYRQTGNSSDYLKNLDKMNGGFSTSFGADGVASGVKSYLLQRMAPGIVSGKDADTALRESMNGTAYSYTDFLTGLSGVIASHMSGPGRNEAADLMSAKIVESISNGRATSIEDTVFDLAFPPNSTDDSLTEGQKTLRNWYSGNIGSSSRMAPYITRLRSHYTYDEKLPEYYAAAELAKAAEESARMERAGRDPASVYRARLNVGTVYWPVTDANGNTVVDPATNVPVIDRRIADRTQYGYEPDGDNTKFEAMMSRNREYYDYGRQYRVAAARKSASQNVADED